MKYQTGGTGWPINTETVSHQTNITKQLLKECSVTRTRPVFAFTVMHRVIIAATGRSDRRSDSRSDDRPVYTPLRPISVSLIRFCKLFTTVVILSGDEGMCLVSRQYYDNSTTPLSVPFPNLS